MKFTNMKTFEKTLIKFIIVAVIAIILGVITFATLNAQSVTSLVIVDVHNNIDVDTINKNVFKENYYNIRAEVESVPDSVTFLLIKDGNQLIKHKEGQRPYYIFRDWPDSLGGMTLFEGKYNIVVEAFFNSSFDTYQTSFEIANVLPQSDSLIFPQSEFEGYLEAFNNLTDTTVNITHRTTFNIIEWDFFLPQSSTGKGVTVHERMYFTLDSINKISWRYRIISGSWWQRNKYFNNQKDWLLNYPEQVYEIIESTASKLIYRLYHKGDLVTIEKMIGIIKETNNYNID